MSVLVALGLMLGVAACSGDGGEMSAPATTFPTSVGPADVDAAAAAVAEVQQTRGAAGRCVELAIASNQELADLAVTAGDRLPAELANVVSSCRSAAELVDDFVAALPVGDPLADGQRACVRDVYLGLTSGDREVLTASAFGVETEGGRAAVAELEDRVQGCGVVLEGD